MFWNKWFQTALFSNFLIFRNLNESDKGHEGGGVAKDAGGKGVEW